MLLPIYTLNLGTPTPTPTGTGAHGPFLLYGLNLAPTPTPTPTPTPAYIREAVAAAISASATIAAVVGTNISPVAPREKKAPPSLTYALVSNVRERTLDGPLGKSRATFAITTRSKSQTDCQTVSNAVLNLLDGFKSLTDGLLGGRVWVDWCHQLDEPDDRIPASDGSDAGTFTTVDSYVIRYREPKPSR